MASGDASSETDHLNDARISSRSRRSRNRPLSTKVESLASTLQDTNRNLRAVDRMLGEYKNIGEQHSTAMDRLKEDLAKTSTQLREERSRKAQHPLRGRDRTMRASDLEDHARDKLNDFYLTAGRRPRRYPTSPHRDYEKSYSDIEYVDFDEQDSHLHRAGVRFYDDMDATHHVHGLHQSVRDLASDQLRMETELNREISRRNRFEHEQKQSLRSFDAKPLIQSAMSSVDQRLQSIQEELRAERALMKKKQEETGKVSAELKQALEQQKSSSILAKISSEEEQQLRSRLGSSEPHRETVEELRRQLGHADEERRQLRIQLSEQANGQTERKRRLALEEREYREHEQHRLESEISDLRSQLGKSAAMVGECRELQQELDRSERQRDQLSDHIQVLNKDLESKEKQSAKVITQHQEMVQKFEESERQKHQTLVELESTLKKLREVTREAETLSVELKETQQVLRESELRREEIKGRAQDTVRQWKLKCKQLEREVDRFKHSSQQSTQRGEELVRELEMTRTHQGTAVQQLDHLKRELSEVLAVRAQQDEQMRVRDVEVNELKSLKMDLEKDLRDSKIVIERLEHELHTAQEKHQSVAEEKTRLEEQQSAIQSDQMMLHSQTQQLQREVKELNLAKVEMTAQLANIATERQDLRGNLQDARRGEASAREEIEILVNRIKEEKDFNNRRLESVQGELEKYKHHESQKVLDMSKRLKKLQVEYEAEVQALRLEVQEERAAGKLLRKQQDKLKYEVDRLNGELARNQEEIAEMQHRHRRVREEFINKSQLTEDGLARAREVELELMDARELQKRIEKDHQNTLYTIAAEVDGVIEETAAESAETIKALSRTGGVTSEPQTVFAELKSKLIWLKSELCARRQKEHRLRLDMHDVMLNTEKDRQFLVAELDRQNEALDQLSSSSREQPSTGQDKQAVSEQPTELSTSSGEVDQSEVISMMEEKLTAWPELSPTKEGKLQKERERIHERYTRLQEALNSLRKELTDTRDQTDSPKEPMLNGDVSHHVSSHTPPRKSCLRVRISSPPTQGPSTPGRDHHRPRSRTPSPGKTLPPLSLTDEEFLERFVPKSPQLRGHRDSAL